MKPEEADGPVPEIAWIEPDDLAADVDATGNEEAVAVTLDLVACWRCGKVVDRARGFCLHCRARLGPAPREVDAGGRGRDGDVIIRFLYVYVAFVVTSVIYGCTVQFHLAGKAPTDEEVRAGLLKLLVVEAVDAVLLLVAVAWLRRPVPLPTIGDGRRLMAWLAAVPGLAALLAVNFGYQRLLRDVLGLPDADPMLDGHPGLIPWIVVGICVQPAIVEEFFFRYLAIGHLRPAVGTHVAVGLSAVMFGLGHIFNPLGMPYLILVGVVFGYARVVSGGLTLPIVLHFAHNLTVIWSEPWL